jgi:hypothetical protein
MVGSWEKYTVSTWNSMVIMMFIDVDERAKNVLLFGAQR